MKIATIIVRLLFGLLFFAASIVVLFNLVPPQEMKGPTKTFMEGIIASGYLLKFIKITELVCSIAFIVGRFVPLATVVIFPITLNILFFSIFTSHEGVAMSVVILLANLFLAYACRKHYTLLLAPKIIPATPTAAPAPVENAMA